MYGVTLLIAASVLGVDYGWQPVEGDSLEYIIQIEPDLVAALEAGEAITSEIPADVVGVRRFRIQIGDDALPQVEHEPLAGGAGGAPTPAQPPIEYQHGDHTHTDPAAADHPPVIPPPAASGGDSGSMYGGGSQYGETSSVPAAEGTSPAAEETSPPASGGSEFQVPRSVDPPPAASSGGDLFTGSGGMFGSGASGTTAPPATLPVERDGPSLELPLLEPPGRENGVAQPATLPEPGPSPFRQPDAFSPATPAGELTGFESEEAPDHTEADHATHDDHEHAAEATPATSPLASGSTPTATPAAETSRPWLPLTMTALLLFASLGANGYLGWILLETLGRYRRLQSDQAG